MRAPMLLPLAAVTLLAAAAPAPALADVDVDVVASGLDNPRHLALGPPGKLYVAEAGRGGDPATSKSCFDSAEGFACTGATGAVTRIDRRTGRAKRIVTGLASFASTAAGSEGDNAIGPHGIFFDGHHLLFTNGGPTEPTRGTPAETVLRDPTLVGEEPVSHLYGRVLEVRQDGVRSLADIWAFERGFNPDAEVGNRAIDSNAVDVLQDDDKLIVADAGVNSILEASPSGFIKALTTFPNVDQPSPFGAGTIPTQAVPTGVVKGPDGAYYVSQLTGFPFPVGGAKVFRVDPATGTYTEFAAGFTNAIDLDFGRDGTLYVLEIDRDSLLGPGTDGGLWAVPPGGGTPERVELPAGTLTAPGGIATGRLDRVYVTNKGNQAGDGQVLQLDLNSDDD